MLTHAPRLLSDEILAKDCDNILLSICRAFLYKITNFAAFFSLLAAIILDAKRRRQCRRFGHHARKDALAIRNEIMQGLLCALMVFRMSRAEAFKFPRPHYKQSRLRSRSLLWTAVMPPSIFATTALIRLRFTTYISNLRSIISFAAA